MNKHILYGAAALVLLLIVVFLLHAIREDGREEQKQTADKKHRAAYLSFTVLVNGAVHQTLLANTPVDVELAIFNPDQQHPMQVADLTDIQPVIKKDNLAVPDIQWQIIAKNTGNIPPLEQAGWHWLTEDPLPAGEYHIFVAIDKSMFAYGNREVGMVRVLPATLQMTDEDNQEKWGFYQRRILKLKGLTEEYLRAVEKAFHSAPDSAGLHIEYIDALQANGDYQQAKAEMLELGYKQQNALDLAELPDWWQFQYEHIKEKLQEH